MNGVLSVIGIALTAAVFALVLQKSAPGPAFLLTLAAGILIFIIVVRGIEQIMQTLYTVLAAAGIEDGLYLPVVKAVGIAAVIRVVASLCRDAGQSSLAVKVEMAGAVAAMGICLPLFERVLEMVSSLIA